jgi:hypothetical protein
MLRCVFMLVFYAASNVEDWGGKNGWSICEKMAGASVKQWLEHMWKNGWSICEKVAGASVKKWLEHLWKNCWSICVCEKMMEYLWKRIPSYRPSSHAHVSALKRVRYETTTTGFSASMVRTQNLSTTCLLKSPNNRPFHTIFYEVQNTRSLHIVFH